MPSEVRKPNLFQGLRCISWLLNENISRYLETRNKQTKNESTKENKSNLPSTNELLKLAEQNNNTAVMFKVFKDIIELRNRTRFTLVKMKSDYYILELFFRFCLLKYAI